MVPAFALRTQRLSHQQGKGFEMIVIGINLEVFAVLGVLNVSFKHFGAKIYKFLNRLSFNPENWTFFYMKN